MTGKRTRLHRQDYIVLTVCFLIVAYWLWGPGW